MCADIVKSDPATDEIGPVTQKELKKYMKRKLIIKKIEDRIAVQRQNIIDRSGLGATVEDGPLTIKITDDAPRVSASTILEEVAKRYGETIAKEIEKLSKKASGSKRLMVEEKGAKKHA